jgi:hypothetical protein
MSCHRAYPSPIARHRARPSRHRAARFSLSRAPKPWSTPSLSASLHFLPHCTSARPCVAPLCRSSAAGEVPLAPHPCSIRCRDRSHTLFPFARHPGSRRRAFFCRRRTSSVSSLVRRAFVGFCGKTAPPHRTLASCPGWRPKNPSAAGFACRIRRRNAIPGEKLHPAPYFSLSTGSSTASHCCRLAFSLLRRPTATWAPGRDEVAQRGPNVVVALRLHFAHRIPAQRAAGRHAAAAAERVLSAGSQRSGAPGRLALGLAQLHAVWPWAVVDLDPLARFAVRCGLGVGNRPMRLFSPYLLFRII